MRTISLYPEMIPHFDKRDFALLTEIISSVSNRKRARGVAGMLLNYFHTLARILSAPEADILSMPGINQQDVAALRRMHATVLETVTRPVLGKPLVDQKALVTMVFWTIGQSPVEKVELVSLDGNNIVLGSEVICIGSESFVGVTPRAVIEPAFRRGAKSIIIAHNHPGGNAEPSDDDILQTRTLVKATSLMGLTLLDHIIVASPRWFSFRAVGYL
jgi:DNA repair protein RadC